MHKPKKENITILLLVSMMLLTQSFIAGEAFAEMGGRCSLTDCSGNTCRVRRPPIPPANGNIYGNCTTSPDTCTAMLAACNREYNPPPVPNDPAPTPTPTRPRDPIGNCHCEFPPIQYPPEFCGPPYPPPTVPDIKNTQNQCENLRPGILRGQHSYPTQPVCHWSPLGQPPAAPLFMNGSSAGCASEIELDF
jgi:hypothetical protein